MASLFESTAGGSYRRTRFGQKFFASLACLCGLARRQASSRFIFCLLKTFAPFACPVAPGDGTGAPSRFKFFNRPFALLTQDAKYAKTNSNLKLFAR